MFTHDRVETRGGFLVAGLRRTIPVADLSTTIAGMWGEFAPMMEAVPGRRGEAAYGVVCGVKDGMMDYMSAVEVDSFDGLPADMGRARIPDQTYAAFKHSGHVSAIGETWAAIRRDWSPNCGFQMASAPDLEIYGDDFDPNTGDGGFEIWVPIGQDAPER